MDTRWESLEACERAVADRGQVLLSTAHLSLVDVGDGELIRIGPVLRPEFVDWRYGPALPAEARKPGFWIRLLGRLPSPPPEGYDPYRGGGFGFVDRTSWLASPFMESASSLTYLFSQVPLAPRCPSCGKPLALRPWHFQRLRLRRSGHGAVVLAPCAFCDSVVEVPLSDARPSLRLALSVVTPPPVLQRVADSAAHEIDALGGPGGLLEELAMSRPELGELDGRFLAGLLIGLDEMAEAEALEKEWSEAEEIASIMDGALSEVPGFEAFRRSVLEEDS